MGIEIESEVQQLKFEFAASLFLLGSEPRAPESDNQETAPLLESTRKEHCKCIVRDGTSVVHAMKHDGLLCIENAIVQLIVVLGFAPKGLK